MISQPRCGGEYTLRLAFGTDQAIRTIVGETPAELAAAVHHHARGILGSSRVDVQFDADTLRGIVRSHRGAVGTFAIEPALPGADTPRVPMHGYTIHDVNDLAAAAVRADRWHKAGDTVDRHDAAWHAIAEHLCTTPAPPGRRELLSVAIRAIDAHVNTEMRHHGYNSADIGAGREAADGFQRFWFARNTPSPEPAIVDRLALDQVWPILTPRQQEALHALAIHGSYQAAAHAIGATQATFNSLIIQGRRRFYRWWHQHETAPRSPWRRDRLVPNTTDSRGRTRLTTSQVDALRARYEGGEKLRAVAADAGIPLSTLSGLLRGTRRPAPDQEAAA